MATAIQTVPGIIAASSQAALGKMSPLAQRAVSLLSVPSVIVTLGANSPVPATYNAAGSVESFLRAATTPATATSTAAAAVSNAPAASVGASTGSSPSVSSALADNFFVDSVAQAAATIEGNPAYASAAAELYMSARMFHSQQALSAEPPSMADAVRPVAALRNVSAVKLV